MKTRTATARDAEKVIELVNCLLEELGARPIPYESAVPAFQSVAANEGAGSVIVAEEDSQVVGVCTLSFQTAMRTAGRYAVIQEMYVVPEHRSRSVGAQLVEHALAVARAHGCRVVELGTPPNGLRQEEFYRREGFEQVGMRFRMRI
ncbi:MAG: GNAT family N-acetyltransferase [SAR202 cluster bacterium]|nr:GNAT family N-acetyltransferase [SAR202 cluster bacterium]